MHEVFRVFKSICPPIHLTTASTGSCSAADDVNILDAGLIQPAVSAGFLLGDVTATILIQAQCKAPVAQLTERVLDRG